MAIAQEPNWHLGPLGRAKYRMLNIVHNMMSLSRRRAARVFVPELGRSVPWKDVMAAHRPTGLSAYVRAANEAETIEAVIRSAVRAVDEIVVVLNNSTDGTRDIVARLAREFPGRVELCDYPFPVEKVGSKRLTTMPDDDPESFVNVSNYALYRCRYSHALKIDGDDLLDAQWLEEVRDAISAGTFSDDEFVYYWGINLWRGAAHEVLANLNFLFPGGLDHACFKLDARAFYTKNRKYEKLVHPYQERNAGVKYLHLKGLKSDCGHGNYDLRGDSYYKREIDHHFARPSTCSLAQLSQRNPSLELLVGNLSPVVNEWTSRGARA